jgi:hypothetical protein
MGRKSKKVIITLIESDVSWQIISKRFHLSKAQSFRVRDEGIYIEKSTASHCKIFVNKMYANGAVTGCDPLDVESLGI